MLAICDNYSLGRMPTPEQIKGFQKDMRFTRKPKWYADTERMHWHKPKATGTR